MNLNVFFAFPSHLFCRSILYGVTNPVHILAAKEICSDPPAPALVDTLLPDFGFEILLVVTMVLITTILHAGLVRVGITGEHITDCGRAGHVGCWRCVVQMLLLLLYSSLLLVTPLCMVFSWEVCVVFARAPNNGTPGRLPDKVFSNEATHSAFPRRIVR